MTELGPFLELLFTTGEARLVGLPDPSDRREAAAVIRRAFAEYRLNIPGPSIDLDVNVAQTAALFTARVCWFAVSRDEPPDQLNAHLPKVTEPKTPSEHLSIDLTLRYLMTIYRRLQAQNAEDVLVTRLAETFRRCPLTGVLSDVAEAPTGDLLFGGHAGLELLYAERLAVNLRPAWLPSEGHLRERVEMVFQQMGKRWPVRE